MDDSTFYMVTGLGSLVYAVFAGLRYYSLTGSNLITSEVAKEMIQSRKIKYVIDVRTKTEYDMGHYRNALHIPVTEMSKKSFKNMTKDKGVLVYCNTGQRARRAADVMRELGFTNVYYIDSRYSLLE